MQTHSVLEGHISARRGFLALSPMAVFMLLYLGISLAVGDFYKIPIAVAMTASAMWAVVIYRGESLSRRIDVFSRAAGSGNIMYMLWVFVLAGAFSALAQKIGAVDATVNLALRYVPSSMIVPGIFAAACFISLSIGTSVGTVVALTPLAVQFSQAGGGADTPFYVAVVLGGAFFGDNLSFISDTTIAATRTQGCDMRDKFRANLWLALPAAVLTLSWYALSGSHAADVVVAGDTNVWLLLPYLMIIATAIAGINVTVVLTLGLLATIVVALFCVPGLDVLDLFGYMGEGIDSMGSLIIITLLASGMLGLIKAMGGINYLLQCLTARVSGRRGAQVCIAVLVSLVNLCTANNTVAIITVGSLSRDIARRFGVDPRKAASLLDSCSCIVQCLIPYGAQTLLATSLADISPAAPFPYLYYPWALAFMVVLSIVFLFPRSLSRDTRPEGVQAG